MGSMCCVVLVVGCVMMVVKMGGVFVVCDVMC